MEEYAPFIKCRKGASQVEVIRGTRTVCPACGDRITLYFPAQRQERIRDLVALMCGRIKQWAAELCGDSRSDFLAVGASVEDGFMEYDSSDEDWAAMFIMNAVYSYEDNSLLDPELSGHSSGLNADGA